MPDTPTEYKNIISDTVHASLNTISLSDAMYHDVEHTCLVTLCGQEIFLGKKIIEGNLNAKDWLHFTISLLLHDIGYVTNILSEDNSNSQKINNSGDFVSLQTCQTDASLTPYHVERGKMYIEQRNWHECIDKKILICKEAEALQDSTDWDITTKKMINLQKRWKSSGYSERNKRV